jgi:tetratricopeptide (TPR) repeat protein
MERCQQAPPPVRSIDPTIPEHLDALITKCLQPKPEDRYQTMSEVVAELGGHAPATTAARTASALGLPGVAPPAPRSRARTWLLAAAGMVAVLAGIGWMMRDQLFPSRPAVPGPAGPVISIAILPFRNDTGDATLDSAGAGLSELLRTQLGESSQVRTVPSARLQQALRDLRIGPNANMAPPEIKSVAEFTSARRVLYGSLTRLGEAIRIDATLEDLDGKAVPLSAMAPNQTGAGLISAASNLADQVRQNLTAGAPDILAELQKTSWKPSTTSFEALRLYSEGQVLTQQGSNQEALKRYEEATQKDSEFALAYSALARSYASLRKETEATKFSQQALDLSAGLPNPQERYLIQANHYRITNQTSKAIEAYENLAKASPNSVMVQFDLGGLYEQAGQLEKAQQYFDDVVKLDPKFVEGLLAVGRVQIRRTNYQAALDPLGSALNLAISFNQEEARANILQAIGVAYRRLDRPEEALKHFSESLELKRKLGNKGGMASSLGEIAVVQMLSGKPREAEQSYNAALALQREIGDKAGTSVTLINLAAFIQNQGHPDQALPLLREALQLRRDAGNPAGISLVLNNIGSVYLATGQYAEAQTNLEQALALREAAKTPAPLADTLHNLAETLSKLGRYDQSLTHYVRALDLRRSSTPPDKRGAALESFAMGTIFDYQGRYGAAVKAKAEALQAFRDLKVRDRWLGETLSGYGNSLSLAGRLADAEKILAEALDVAKELKNPNLTSQTLRFQAERLWYAGDIKGANALALEAAQAATLAPDKSHTLLAQSTVSMTAAALQPSAAEATRLGSIAQEADKAGLQPLSVESSLRRVETLLKLNSRAAARQDADRAVAKAETLGFRLLRARAQYLRGELLRAAKDPGARRAYAEALRVLDEIKAEDGSQDVLKRADLGPMYAECTKWSKAQ